MAWPMQPTLLVELMPKHHEQGEIIKPKRFVLAKLLKITFVTIASALKEAVERFVEQVTFRTVNKSVYFRGMVENS